MKSIVLGFTILVLAGCTELRTVVGFTNDVQVSIVTVAVTGNTFDALEATATNYLSLNKCNGNNGPVCRSPAATKAIIPAIRAGRVARNNLEQFFIDHPGQVGSKVEYDALLKVIKTLQEIFHQYNIGA